jgi:alpha-D-xyloside xylohydrolase
VTEKLRISISRKTCSFSYYDNNGRLLTKEPDRGGKSLTKINVEKSVFDQNQEIKVGQSVDGLRVKAEGYTKVVDRTAYHTKLEFEWCEGEALYGLGSHEEGIMNLRGSHQYLYQQNMKAVVPVLVSTQGYGILLDTYTSAIFRDDVYGSYLWTDTDDEMDYYFIYGPEFDDIIGQYRRLTGKAPMLPKWAFGYAQSKERYKSQEELISVIKEFRDRQIPIDLIVLDWMSWPGNLWGQKTFDPERFPDPSGMTEELHNYNARLMISIWPNMSAGGENHKDMLEKGFLLGNQSTYDAFNSKARELYWQQANNGLFINGIDAWWCDCSEPFEADWKGEVKPEPEERVRLTTLFSEVAFLCPS